MDELIPQDELEERLKAIRDATPSGFQAASCLSVLKRAGEPAPAVPRGLLEAIAASLNPTTAKLVSEHQRMVLFGLARGLTTDQVNEVISTVRDWHQPRGTRPSWQDLRHRLGLRATGEEWRP
jgi:hypothetical protein